MMSRKSFSIRFTISAISLLIAGGLALSLLSEGGFFARKFALSAVDQLFSQITEKTSERVLSVDRRPQDLISVLSLLPQIQEPPQPGVKHPATALFVRALATNKDLYGLYVGHENGELYMVANIGAWPRFKQQRQAPLNAQWAVISVTTKGERSWEYLDSELRVLGSEIETTDYDPRNRLWFEAAQKSEQIVKTEPYVFSSLQAPGITYATTIPGNGKVLGADISLTTLSHFMAEQKVTDNSVAFIFNQNGRFNVYPDLSKMVLATESSDSEKGKAKLAKIHHLYPTLADKLLKIALQGGGTDILSNDKEELMTLVKPINSDPKNKEFLALIVPTQEILKPYRDSGLIALLTAIFIILIFMPLAWYVSTRISRPIKMLADESKKVENFDFENVQRVESRIVETAQLSDSIYSMAHSIADYRSNLLHTGEKLEKLVDLGIALSAEKNADKLMETILLAAKDLSHADGGTLYIREENKNEDKLCFEIIRNDSLNIALGGTTGLEVDLPAVPLRDSETGEENHNNVVSHSVILEKTVNICDAYAETQFDFSGTRAFDEKSGYHSQSFLTVPLKARGAGVIGALQLINAMDQQGNRIPFSQETQDFVEALAAQAAVALENRNLLLSQVKLFDSMIELIAKAIDAKSPYTGGHCLRVPEICQMLAEAADQSTETPFNDFHLETEDEWRELSISAWLHDCGKLTTPEYVVDKATKLETIYDRFHEIRTRFEVLRRDFEISYLEALLQKEKDPEQLKQERDGHIQQLEEDFQFLAECNLGGEFMAEEKIERLKQIAERKWLRHFDDRIGLSRNERLRKEATPEKQLPAEEKLLADRPEHVIPRTIGQELYGENNPYGIKMKVPENLYNQGEIYNLCIQRGTLNDEERFKINEHIIQSIAMLKELPFPKQMAKVAEYAGAHHETLIGTGYPCKLTAEQMSIPARIMAIADIFEALTASDRPYKQAKTLSESIKIMHFMRKDQHIDSDLFELFLTQGIYKKYAKDYLKPEQIDEVDLSQYLNWKRD